ncbi:Subtilase-type proteinase psp3 [Holothuria leucospilota]|uniref:Subtilase-type proteinase psp3 n=1 Tax=Holothuria leucospilota TaxID=206669 RepID=A0A9Q1HH89_HOLLE|nr:Subtilase-type proteinase psp3 [Holothuria leucospilota]
MKIKLLLPLLLSFCSASQGFLAPLTRVKERIDGHYLIKVKEDFEVDSVVSSIQNNPSFNFVGGRVNRVYRHAVKGFSARLSEKALDMVRKMDAIEYVAEDGIMHLMYNVDSWGVDRVDQRYLPLDEQYNPKYDGTGVTVYVIDSGVTPTHVDVAGRCSVGVDMVNEDPTDPEYGIDCLGHGTHCAGIVGGTVYGVAKNVELVGVRIFDCRAHATIEDVVAGMDWVAANAVKPAVASMSIGWEEDYQMIDDAVYGMKEAGITGVAAACNYGNDACGCTPGRSPDFNLILSNTSSPIQFKVITVGATIWNDTRASYSCYGTCVDIFAPGTLIKSNWYAENNATRRFSGTSMSCPHVAGAAALYLQREPEASPALVKAYILNTATPNVVLDSRSPDQNNKMLYIEKEHETL